MAKAKRPAKEWVDLFLAVADLVDSDDWEGENIRDAVKRAYQKLFDGVGRKIYSEEVEKGSAFLRNFYGD